MTKKILLIFCLILIPILAILPLLRSGYFNMHDIQHPVRLFLLNQGLSQGYFYPRWVDGLGFGYGYPLFNFYPPLIYYIAQIFVFLGFSIISSIKLMLISGFVLASVSSYLYIKQISNKITGLIGSFLYTYTFYHAITIYVRGAFAEFYSISIFPLVAYFLHGLILKPTRFKMIGLGLSFAALILCHPLIAFPSVIFIGAYFILAYFISKNPILSWQKMILGLILGLSLSAFFWLPSLVEKNLTMVNTGAYLITEELSKYKLHFVYPFQLYYSPWGFGGSTAGLADGISYQIGKYYLVLLLFSFITSFIYLFKKNAKQTKIVLIFTFGLLLFSYFMTLPYSVFIWDRIKYLSYLQFPWRFFTFAGFYLSIFCALGFYLISRLIKSRFVNKIFQFFWLVLLLILVFRYSQLFQPQKFLAVTDKELTNNNQIRWVISKSSFEFVPKGVKTTEGKFNTITLDIKKKDLPQKNFEILKGKGEVKEVLNKFQSKSYLVKANKPIMFQLNTYNFAGWQATLDGEEIIIDSNNKLKLIRVKIPSGEHKLDFVFRDTWPRTMGNILSILSLFVFILLFCLQIRTYRSKQKI